MKLGGKRAEKDVSNSWQWVIIINLQHLFLLVPLSAPRMRL